MKIIEKHQELRTKVKEAVSELSSAVASTMGPKGRTVLIHQKGKMPFASKDGVTVASVIDFSDPVKNAVAQVIKQASAETGKSAGDGTTTSTVLVRSIVENAEKYILAGSNPTDLQKGMQIALREIKKEILDSAKPVEALEDIEHIATISANGDKQIGSLLSMAVDKAGKDAAITIEESKSLETSLDIVEGFQIDSGFFSPQFITDERKMSMRYDKPLILVTDYVVDNLDDLMPSLEIAAREKRPFIIVAETVEGQALAALILNTVRGTMRVAAIKAPRYGEERRSILEDLAIAVGATFINQLSGKTLKEVKLEDLGSAKAVESMKNWSTFVSGNGKYEQVEARIEKIKQEIQNTPNLQEAEALQERITRLSSGVAIVKVGGSTEVEMIEKKHRIEDALEAIKSAQEEGVVCGGGMTLLRISRKNLKFETENEDQNIGAKILMKAIEEPFRQIANNAGINPDVLISGFSFKDKEKNKGYDFAKEEYVNDMHVAGIIDPAKVTRCALENAVSVASTLLTTEFAVIETN